MRLNRQAFAGIAVLAVVAALVFMWLFYPGPKIIVRYTPPPRPPNPAVLSFLLEKEVKCEDNGNGTSCVIDGLGGLKPSGSLAFWARLRGATFVLDNSAIKLTVESDDRLTITSPTKLKYGPYEVSVDSPIKSASFDVKYDFDIEPPTSEGFVVMFK